MTVLSRRWCGPLLLAVLALFLTAASDPAELPAPPDGTYSYSVSVSGRGKVGEMTVTLTQSGDEVTARIDRRIRVKVLGITAYRSESSVTQTLKEGRLTALRRDTDDDGEKTSLTVALTDDRLQVSDGSKSWTESADLLPSSTWNPAILTRRQLLDTKTGKPVEVTTEAKGKEELLVAGRRMQATRYEQRGGDPRSLWFDESGRLLREVLQREDSTVTLELQKGP